MLKVIEVHNLYWYIWQVCLSYKSTSPSVKYFYADTVTALIVIYKCKTHTPVSRTAGWLTLVYSGHLQSYTWGQENKGFLSIKENSSPTVNIMSWLYILVAVHMGGEETQCIWILQTCTEVYLATSQTQSFHKPFGHFLAIFCHFYEIYNCNYTLVTHFCISFNQSATVEDMLKITWTASLSGLRHHCQFPFCQNSNIKQQNVMHLGRAHWVTHGTKCQVKTIDSDWILNTCIFACV